MDQKVGLKTIAERVGSINTEMAGRKPHVFAVSAVQAARAHAKPQQMAALKSAGLTPTADSQNKRNSF